MMLNTIFTLKEKRELIERISLLEEQVKELKADAIINDGAIRGIIKAVVSLQRAEMLDSINKSLGIK